MTSTFLQQIVKMIYKESRRNPAFFMTYLSKRFIFFFIGANAPFFLVKFFVPDGRGWFNIDYAIIFLVGILVSEGRGALFLLSLLFFVAFVVDAVAWIHFYFSFVRLSNLFDLLSFVSYAPYIYRYVFGLVVFVGALYATLLIIFLLKTNNNQKEKIPHLVLILLLISFFVKYISTYYFDYRKIIDSQLYESMNSNGVYVVSKGGNIENGKYAGAIDYLGLRGSSESRKKILLIIVESFGVFRDEVRYGKIIDPLLDIKEKYINFKSGEITYDGSTLSAEMRELCGLGIINPFVYSGRDERFDKCIPHQLLRDGYYTYAIHGASGIMYSRDKWYPDMGFKNEDFYENLPRNSFCRSFPGRCDRDLFPRVAAIFKKNNKAFVHWMTLNSHSPYDLRDLKYSEKCSYFLLPDGSETCRNALLVHDFMRNLAEFIVHDDSMRGVRVVIVGDHEPPIFGGEHGVYYKPKKVPWFSFDVL